MASPPVIKHQTRHNKRLMELTQRYNHREQQYIDSHDADEQEAAENAMEYLKTQIADYVLAHFNAKNAK